MFEMNVARMSPNLVGEMNHIRVSLLNATLGRTIPDWPQLLHLYSRLKPGKTVLQWIQDYGIEEMDIDVRRFTSFGVIKVALLTIGIFC